jgi:adenylyltransferase/sulfurtransferase
MWRGAPPLSLSLSLSLSLCVCVGEQVSNLHRQVIHGGTEPGVNKAVSARRAVGRLNPDVECSAYTTRFTAANADELVSAYDVVIDASDNLLTRYMVNDACVLHRKPLVSGAAIGSEGQVSVYNHGDDGLCYRCLFPEPPPAATVSSCSEHGVLGMVPGVVGCMQALEALKLLSGPTAAATPDLGPPPPRSPPRSPPPGMRGAASLSRRLCIFDALACEFRSIKLPRRSPTCAVCAGRAKAGAPHGAGAGAGAVPIMSNGRPIIRSMAESYAWCELRQLASPKACVRPQLAPQLPARHRITCREYLARVQQQQQQQTPPQTPPPSPPAPPWLLLDVREAVQFAICALPHAVNIPLRQLMEAQPAGGGGGGGSGGGGGRLSPRGLSRVGELAAGRPVYVVCRRGVDSVTAVQQLLAATAAAAPGGEGEGEGEGGRRRRGLSAAQMILNIDGGLQEWHRSVDPTFPLV